MEEQFLFAQIHDALDIPTPPGAFERLRTELTKKPVRPRPWPVLQMRTSSMGFRLAAGLAIVAIAVAAAAALVVIHNGSSNISPAGSRMSIQAYKAMITKDYVDPNRAWVAPCDETQHSGCGQDAERSLPLLQAWLNDLDKSRPPVRFAFVHAEMQLQLAQSITGLHALDADSRAHDGAAMTRDYVVASYGAAWVQIIVPAIVASQQVDSATYTALVKSETRTLDACGAACGFTATSSNCLHSSGVTCSDYFYWVAQSFASYQADVLRKAAPGSLSEDESRLQADFGAANSILLTMNLAVAAADQEGFNAGIAQLKRAVTQVDLDAAKITG